jgi:hypothetical protein
MERLKSMQSVNFKARNRAILYILIGVVTLLYMVAFIRVGGNPFPRKVYAKKTQTALAKHDLLPANDMPANNTPSQKSHLNIPISDDFAKI